MESIHTRVEKALTAAHASIGTLLHIDRALWEAVCVLVEKREGKIVLTGVGKSGYIAMKVAATLTSLGSFASFLHPTEAMHGDLGGVSSGDVVIAFSYSGNTRELVECLRHLRNTCAISIIGITKSETSLLGKLSDYVLPVTISEEGCPLNLAPMASTTTMLAIGDALAAGITEPTTFTNRDFARFHPSGTLGLSLTPVSERARMCDDIHVHHHTPLHETLVTMGVIGKGIVAVVDDAGSLVGSITDGDIRRFIVMYGTSEGKRALDVMSREPKSIEQTQSLKDALVIMESHKITSLFVVDESGRPQGVIHIHDIVSA
jgi:arabinose-5-phosphate isomerase